MGKPAHSTNLFKFSFYLHTTTYSQGLFVAFVNIHTATGSSIMSSYHLLNEVKYCGPLVPTGINFRTITTKFHGSLNRGWGGVAASKNGSAFRKLLRGTVRRREATCNLCVPQKTSQTQLEGAVSIAEILQLGLKISVESNP